MLRFHIHKQYENIKSQKHNYTHTQYLTNAANNHNSASGYLGATTSYFRVSSRYFFIAPKYFGVSSKHFYIEVV